MTNPARLKVEKLTYVKSKIVATIGPASEKYETIREMTCAGADVFRLNFAHGSHEWLDGIVEKIRRASHELNRPIGILGDLSGPKIRLHKLPNDAISCLQGEKFEFIRGNETTDRRKLTCTYGPLVDELEVGNPVLLADGTVAMRVVEKYPNEGRLVCVVEQGGTFKSRQGLNLPGASLSTPCLTDKDRKDLDWALQTGLDFVALSFVRRAEDVAELQREIQQRQPKNVPLIVSKIEKMEAVSDLDRILEYTDVVMVARGDLGVEVDIARVPTLQKRIIKLCNQHRVPVITATQMLESMQNNTRPTRAEASDVANAVLDGTDAVMLSGESAAGEYPVESVFMMSRLAHEAERYLPPRDKVDVFTHAKSRALAVTEAVTHGAGQVAEMLGAEVIVVGTETGRTALAVSKQRLTIPTLGMTPNSSTARKMTLYWGVTPLEIPSGKAGVNDLTELASEWLRRETGVHAGSKIVLVSGSKISAEGHDLLLVHTL
ncbi:MAG: pyruvate kinase [Planctomycetaceae bacterium]|nr:pyruvate kinase [Planctomycetaceae bacterium]